MEGKYGGLRKSTACTCLLGQLVLLPVHPAVDLQTCLRSTFR